MKGASSQPIHSVLKCSLIFTSSSRSYARFCVDVYGAKSMLSVYVVYLSELKLRISVLHGGGFLNQNFSSNFCIMGWKPVDKLKNAPKQKIVPLLCQNFCRQWEKHKNSTILNFLFITLLWAFIILFFSILLESAYSFSYPCTNFLINKIVLIVVSLFRNFKAQIREWLKIMKNFFFYKCGLDSSVFQFSRDPFFLKKHQYRCAL